MPGANNGLLTLSFMVRIERTYSLINIQLSFFPPSISWIGVLFHFDLGWVWRGSLKLALLTATSDLCFHRSPLPSYLLLCFGGSKLALQSIHTGLGAPCTDVKAMDSCMPEWNNALAPTMSKAGFRNPFCLSNTRILFLWTLRGFQKRLECRFCTGTVLTTNDKSKGE